MNSQSKRLSRIFESSIAALFFLIALSSCESGPVVKSEPSKTTPAPRVTLAYPSNHATTVGTGSRVSATFDLPLNSSTVHSESFLVQESAGNRVAGSVTYDLILLKATFAPGSPLAAGTTYIATLTTEIESQDGRALTQAHVWWFTTGSGADTTAPTVVGLQPGDGDVNVLFDRTVSAEFSEAMDPATINSATVIVRDGSANPVAGTVVYNENDWEVTFYPATDLAPNTTYTARITTGTQDLSGNPLAVDRVWSFTTGSLADTTPPQVASISPADGDMMVSPSVAIRAVFSEPLDSATVNLSTVRVVDSMGNSIDGILTYDGSTNTVTFAPSADLLPAITVIVTLTVGIKDSAGNPLTASYSWSFMTGAM